MKSLCYLLFPILLIVVGCKTYRERPDLVDIRRYTPPAERGDAYGQYRLGQAYASHRIYPQANTWYRKAALQGNADAMYALGQNYLEGYGGPKNAIEAYAWFDVATSQNQVLARNARECLNTRMNRAEIESGRRRAAALFAEIPPEKLIYARSRNVKDEEVAKTERAPAEKATEVKPAPAQPAPKAPTPAAATGKSLHYGSDANKGAEVQTAP